MLNQLYSKLGGLNKRNIKNKLRQLLIFALVAIMAIPHIGMRITFASPWANLPTIAPYRTNFEMPQRADYEVLNLLDLLMNMDDFDSFTAEEQNLIMEHLGLGGGSLLHQATPEEIAQTIEAETSLDFNIQENLEFAMLMVSGMRFSALSPDNHALIYRQLDIAFGSQGTAHRLFMGNWSTRTWATCGRKGFARNPAICCQSQTPAKRKW